MTVLPAHGGQLSALARQFGVDADGLIDFSASISPYPPPATVLERLGRAAADPHFLSLYPDSENRELCNAVAAYVGVPADAVVVANGVMPLLAAALRGLGVRQCMVVTPAFRGYQEALRIAGVESVEFALRSEDGFLWTPDLLVEGALRLACDAILLANPHSPSGVTVARARVLALRERAAASEMKVLLDEAFIDFVPECSVSSFAAEGDALIAFRSPTKFFSIPALRVAYAIASPEVAEKIHGFVHEWAVSSVAAVACSELLGCCEHQETVRLQTERERRWLMQRLGELEVNVFPSATNFLLIRVGSAESGLDLWRALIRNRGIVLRNCGNFTGLNTSYLRFGVRLRHENERLLEGLAAEYARASFTV
jgi:threonine-phosphate decarboxylase